MRYPRLIPGVFAILSATALIVPCSATTHEIHADGSGDYATIQDAVDASVNGDVIVLTDGTYTGTGNYDIDFGGRAITVRSESGDPKTCVIDCEATLSDNRRAFYLHSGEGSGARVIGLTLTGGRIMFGGGIYISDSSPTIEDCIFTDNYSLGGAGLTAEESGSSITDCIFYNNFADATGGGTYCYVSTPIASTSDPVFTRCVFYANTADTYGGGAACEDASPQFIGCTFYGNSAPAGGGLYAFAGTAPQLETTIIAASADGEAIGCEDVTAAPTLSCCDLHGNADGDWTDCIADQAGGGGNLSADPLFCDAGDGNFTLRGDSPCAPAHSGGCGRIGAWPVGCDAPARPCCVAGNCNVLTQEQCDDAGGRWQLEVETCDPNPCPIMGACCVGPNCVLTTHLDCNSAGGDWHPNEPCSPLHDCMLLRACCIGPACYLMWPDECSAAGGLFLSGALSCLPNPCGVDATKTTWGAIKAAFRE